MKSFVIQTVFIDLYQDVCRQQRHFLLAFCLCNLRWIQTKCFLVNSRLPSHTVKTNAMVFCCSLADLNGKMCLLVRDLAPLPEGLHKAKLSAFRNVERISKHLHHMFFLYIFNIITLFLLFYKIFLAWP